MPFVSRAGQKLDHALTVFNVTPTGLTCADLGCSTGGFTDCLLQRGASKVYSVDTGYGVIDWKLRNDPRVVLMERTNAMHVQLPDRVPLITIDVSWTRQKNILPHALGLLAPGGRIITLIKPHYEAPPKNLRKGKLPDDDVAAVERAVLAEIESLGFTVRQTTASPIRGTGGNAELLALLEPTSAGPLMSRGLR